MVALCANASSTPSNTTNPVWLVPKEDRTSALVSAVFLLLIVLVGLPWNILVFVTILKEKLFKQPTIMILLNLIVADLLAILLVMGFEIQVGLTGEFGLPGESDRSRCASCDVSVVLSVFTTISLFTISFMSFDRFLFIYKPLRYEKLLTSLRALFVLVALWVLSIIVSFLPLVGFGDILFNPAFLSCGVAIGESDLGPSVVAYIVFLFALSVVPIVLLVIFNAWVIVIVEKNIRAIYVVRRSIVEANKDSVRVPGKSDRYKHMKKKRQDKEIHMVLVFGGLLVANLLSWLPIVIVGLSTVISSNANLFPTELYYTVNILYWMQVATHPIVETVVIKDVREPVTKLLTCRWFRKKLKYSDMLTISGDNSELTCCSKGVSCPKYNEFLSLFDATVFHHHPRSSRSGTGARSSGDIVEQSHQELDQLQLNRDKQSPEDVCSMKSEANGQVSVSIDVNYNDVQNQSFSSTDEMAKLNGGNNQDPPTQKVSIAGSTDFPTHGADSQYPPTPEVGGADSQYPPTPEVGGADSQNTPTPEVGGADSPTLEVGGADSEDPPTLEEDPPTGKVYGADSHADSQDLPSLDVGGADSQDPPASEAGGFDSQDPPNGKVYGADIDSQDPPTLDVGGADSQDPPALETDVADSQDPPTG